MAHTFSGGGGNTGDPVEACDAMISSRSVPTVVTVR